MYKKYNNHASSGACFISADDVGKGRKYFSNFNKKASPLKIFSEGWLWRCVIP
jgi:hypothetical protein